MRTSDTACVREPPTAIKNAKSREQQGQARFCLANYAPGAIDEEETMQTDFSKSDFDGDFMF